YSNFDYMTCWLVCFVDRNSLVVNFSAAGMTAWSVQVNRMIFGFVVEVCLVAVPCQRIFVDSGYCAHYYFLKPTSHPFHCYVNRLRLHENLYPSNVESYLLPDRVAWRIAHEKP